MTFLLLLTLFIIIAVVLGWHIVFALVGGVIAIGAGIWAILVLSIVLFCVAILLLFLLTGFGGLLIGVLFALWTMVAIVLFPVLFPILLPLFIIYALLRYLFKRRKQKEIVPRVDK